MYVFQKELYSGVPSLLAKSWEGLTGSKLDSATSRMWGRNQPKSSHVLEFQGRMWWKPVCITTFCTSLSPPLSTLWLPAVFVSVLCVLKSLLSWETQLKSLSARDPTSARISGTSDHLSLMMLLLTCTTTGSSWRSQCMLHRPNER
jgi:hypothetical protein